MKRSMFHTSDILLITLLKRVLCKETGCVSTSVRSGDGVEDDAPGALSLGGPEASEDL